MALLDQLNADMKEAMKAKEKDRLSVIRMLKASLQNEAIHLGVTDLNEDQELTVLSREVKQRRDSLKEFKEAAREDLAAKIEQELTYVNAYLPAQLTEEELKQIISETAKMINAEKPSDMGKLMGAVVPKTKGRTDGALVSKLVKAYLSQE
ncbi:MULTISPECIES: GatB/YqeY domain-containing protein [Turicibacter]|uniref:GatB/YqeY domain-containing protein n=2 Tax=Turicibacter sanguinis TaxID=154288 RepID=A0A173SU99_9FIRM|nr:MULTISPECIES: GatB/YqeY domain-containing protein [Turicibacter]KAB3587124.1 GatB/YqeY domain-containing protein [Phocaeicola vulgatus]EFF64602.1 YqeY-like protein [Turicibacter sanguinis PC909]EGC91237.1 YqeY-like protein [Turicibacter sp. HGF1]MBP3904654.1 GatB/YqeY domain-containing protein [Turicibacter sp.]MBP3909721.1 GatB/YqeY domain-containing protein [Turicibacter sp.]